MPIICPNCNTRNSENNRFCSRCGAQLTQRPASVGNANLAAPRPDVSNNGFGGGLGIAAFALSIVSCALCFLPNASSMFALACGIVGLVFSIKVRKRLAAARLRNGKILAAFIMSIVGTAISSIMVLVYFISLM